MVIHCDDARLGGITDPRLAVLVHAIVGGTPAYRREYVRDDAPADFATRTIWVVYPPPSVTASSTMRSVARATRSMSSCSKLTAASHRGQALLVDLSRLYGEAMMS
jgi:hypothetical protein